MGGDLFFLLSVIFDRVAAVRRAAYQNKYCSPGLGAGASTSEKPPAFRKGKQVVCAIWVPSGIACKVTVYAHPMDSG